MEERGEKRGKSVEGKISFSWRETLFGLAETSLVPPSGGESGRDSSFPKFDTRGNPAFL